MFCEYRQRNLYTDPTKLTELLATHGPHAVRAQMRTYSIVQQTTRKTLLYR